MVEWSDDATAIECLVRRAGTGDAVAFAGLYDAYAPRLRRFLRHQVGDDHAAEDLLQQTFMKMIEALPRYRSRGLPFGAWVFRIARNLVIDGRRTAHPAAPIEAAVDRPADGDGPERAAELADERAQLLVAIDGLPADQRDVVVWRFFGELSPAETGALMGRSAEAVRSLQHRAILALRARLGADGSVADWQLR
jgi:RNA polymerase sigma-70 factor (ECF subfamily)